MKFIPGWGFEPRSSGLHLQGWPIHKSLRPLGHSAQSRERDFSFILSDQRSFFSSQSKKMSIGFWVLHFDFDLRRICWRLPRLNGLSTKKPPTHITLSLSLSFSLFFLFLSLFLTNTQILLHTHASTLYFIVLAQTHTNAFRYKCLQAAMHALSLSKYFISLAQTHIITHTLSHSPSFLSLPFPLSLVKTLKDIFSVWTNWLKASRALRWPRKSWDVGSNPPKQHWPKNVSLVALIDSILTRHHWWCWRLQTLFV